MLINFCRKCLQTTATCNAVSNDGYEVTNLTSDSDRGYLAYSCIKPPIHVDLTFICDVQISHILVWPSVGAQKSSGFELSVKFGSEYKRASIGFLNPSHSGILFYRRDVDQSNIETPSTFLHRYTQLPNGHNMNCVRNMRLSVLKTENSVPAIGRLEVWARVSPSNGKDTVARIHNLLQNNNKVLQAVETIEDVQTSSINVVGNLEHSIEEGPTVPDCFMDPITWNIMIQPIVLPSGAIIDQSTLEKYGKTEATWGRSLSDPFTGIRFNDSHKPVIASALKARIDKFLLENKNLPDVKNMPRLSGHKQVVMALRNRSLELSDVMPDSTTITSPSNLQNFGNDKSADRSHQTIKSLVHASPSNSRHETRAHRLPIIPMCSKRGVTKTISKTPMIKTIAISAIRMEMNEGRKEGNKDSNLDQSVKTILSNLPRFDKANEDTLGKCLKNCRCISKVFYKLPCGHILCRDALMTIKDSQCANCKLKYNSRDLERIHAPFGFS